MTYSVLETSSIEMVDGVILDGDKEYVELAGENHKLRV